MKQSGGLICVDSEKGGGAAFTIDLPRVYAEAPVKQETDTQVPAGGTGSDVIMPGLDGVRLRALLAGAPPHLPVLFMSGIAPEELVRQGRVEAGSPILRKPFDPAALAAEVRRSLGVATRK